MELQDLGGLEVRLNGELILHATTFKLEKPKNHEEMIKLFEDLLGFMKAPDVEDKEMF